MPGRDDGTSAMKSLTIRNRILLSFAALMAVMSVIAVLAYAWFRQTEREAVIVETNTIPALYQSMGMTALWAESHGLSRQFVQQLGVTERAALAETILGNRAKLRAFLVSYARSVDAERDRQIYEEARQRFEQVFAAEDALLKAGDAGPADGRPGPQLAAAGRELDTVAARLQTTLRDMVEFNKQDTEVSTQRIVAVVRMAEYGLILAFVVALGLSLLCGYSLFRAITVPLGRLLNVVDVMRHGDFSGRLQLARQDEFSELAGGFNTMSDDLAALIGQVQRSGIQVSTSITEIAATSKEQQATASEIAATTTEIGATAKEISATSNELVRTMHEVSSVAEQTASLAGGGQAGLERMEATMRHVMEAAGAINAKLAILSDKAGNINQVVTTITKVADRTNLLSLNAAIEAEKAGQYGRGFAVVATEIRRLADQTAASTYDIEQMVKDIQSAVSAGVMGMDKFSEEVRRGMQEVQQVGGQRSEIIDQVQGLVPRFEVANEGMQAQATGAGQISEALSQLGEAAQQTVESLHQSTVAIDELNQVSSGLRSSISRFKLGA